MDNQNIIHIKVSEIPAIIKDLQKIFTIHFLKKNGEARVIATRNDMIKIKETIKGVRPTSEEVKKNMITTQDINVLKELKKQGANIKDPKVISSTWRRAIFSRITKIVGNGKTYIIDQD